MEMESLGIFDEKFRPKCIILTCSYEETRVSKFKVYLPSSCQQFLIMVYCPHEKRGLRSLYIYVQLIFLYEALKFVRELLRHPVDYFCLK